MHCPSPLPYFSENNPNFLLTAPHQNGSFVFVNQSINRTEYREYMPHLIREQLYEAMHEYRQYSMPLCNTSKTKVSKIGRAHV